MVTDDAWRFDCCGVVAAWEMNADWDDWVDLQVWENVDKAAKKATMKDFNQVFGTFKSLSFICSNLSIEINVC